MQKQMIGEKLFPAVAKYQPVFAGRITGMMLEIDNSELLNWFESAQLLENKIGEALRVLEGVEPTLAGVRLGESGAMETGTEETGLLHG
eukprot:5576879-Lingulodinium_polyedra.AAC.1